MPAAADDELVSLGYDEVFRVSGANRYGTAAAIADALGVGRFVDPATPCTDPAVNDGDARTGFYGNAAVELRDSASTCRVLGRTVVLAEGGTGADALAAGMPISISTDGPASNDRSEERRVGKEGRSGWSPYH